MYVCIYVCIYNVCIYNVCLHLFLGSFSAEVTEESLGRMQEDIKVSNTISNTEYLVRYVLQYLSRCIKSGCITCPPRILSCWRVCVRWIKPGPPV